MEMEVDIEPKIKTQIQKPTSLTLKIVKNMVCLVLPVTMRSSHIPCIFVHSKCIIPSLLILEKYMNEALKTYHVGHWYLVQLDALKIQHWEAISKCTRVKLVNLGLNENHFHNLSTNDLQLMKEKDAARKTYKIVGHILDLQYPHFATKQTIQRCLKVPNCLTIVHKVSNIDQTAFQTVLLGGVRNYRVQITENNCIFEFHYNEVYWSSDMAHERTLLLDEINYGDAVFDVFAGIGLIAIPALKKGATVITNDPNDNACQWLHHSSVCNELNMENLQIYCNNARDFVLTDLRDHLLRFINKTAVHIVLALPCYGTHIVDAFIDFYTDNEIEDVTKPVYVYIFCTGEGEHDCLAKYCPRYITENLSVLKLTANILIGNKLNNRKCYQ